MIRSALVTGASEGIGRAFVILLASKGYQVTAVARNEARLKELIKEVGANHTYVVADLSTSQGIESVKQVLVTRKQDLLINNAGFGVFGWFHESKVADQMNMMRLNCDALVELSHAFLKTSVKGDALMNVSSTASFLPIAISSLYSATKSFVTMFSEGLWYEQRRRGVFVMALCPGATRTKFHTRAGGEEDDIPEWTYQTAEQVANIGWRALQGRRRPVVICGLQAPLIFLTRFIPRKLTVFLAGRVSEDALT